MLYAGAKLIAHAGERGRLHANDLILYVNDENRRDLKGDQPEWAGP